jgi:hypothetical protein
MICRGVHPETEDYLVWRMLASMEGCEYLIAKMDYATQMAAADDCFEEIRIRDSAMILYEPNNELIDAVNEAAEEDWWDQTWISWPEGHFEFEGLAECPSGIAYACVGPDYVWWHTFFHTRDGTPYLQSGALDRGQLIQLMKGKP